MLRVGFSLQKGGVGKTTLSGNVAAALSDKLKTVILDCDPQGNCSSWLLKDPMTYELADVLLEKVSAGRALIEIKPGLSMLGTFGLNGQLQAFADLGMVNKPFIFANLCEELEGLGFEAAIFDLSPGLGILERYVILAMHEVVTPLTPEFFSLDGIEIFTNELGKINRDYKRQVRHRRIIANGVNRSFRRHRVVYEEFMGKDFQLFTVPQDAKLAESQFYHQSIFQYEPESKSVPALREIAAALAEEVA